MTTIENLFFGSLSAKKLLLTESNNYAVIIPEFGGVLNALSLGGNQVIAGAENSDLLTSKKRFNGAKLMPFPNRISDGKYTFDGTTYQLPINRPKEHNAIHGFVFNKPFEVVREEVSGSIAILELGYDYDGSYEGYPFPFRLLMKYELSNEGISCETTIDNTGNQICPIGDGWHPYFTLDRKVDDLLLQLSTNSRIVVDELMIPTGAKEPFAEFNELRVIGDAQFDTAFELATQGDTIESKLIDPKTGKGLAVWQTVGDGQYNYIQVYIPPTRDCIALEPMTCIANTFNNGEGLMSLKSGESWSGRYGVKLVD